MKKFLLKIIVAVIIVGMAYGAFFSLEYIGSGRIVLVQDLRTKKNIRIIKPQVGNCAFVWQGSFPGWFLIYEIPDTRMAFYKVKIAIPGLENVKDDHYSMQIPIQAVYRINVNQFADPEKLGDKFRGLDTFVYSLFEGELKKELAKYLEPAYQREAILEQLNSIVAIMMKNLQAELKGFGIELMNVKIIGSISLPDRVIYNEGLEHAADLRKFDKINEKEIIEVRSKMEREKIINERFFAKLKELSSIIKSNPDILKYIYIDKMAPNVNVILSSDVSGIPAMLNNELKQTKGKSKLKDIDNLK